MHESIHNENGMYSIKFAKDTFGPYNLIFCRKDLYYQDIIDNRGNILFPFKNIQFDNTEIFLETDDVIVCTGDRINLGGKEKTFVDIINLKTGKKQRLYVEEVNLIYNSRSEIVVNANFNGVWKTVKLDQETMEIKEEKEEKLLAFFKVIYNENEQKWYRLDWNGIFYNSILENNLKETIINEFDAVNFTVNNKDIWKVSCEKMNTNNKNFINNQNYVMDDKFKHRVLNNYYGIFGKIYKNAILTVLIITILLLFLAGIKLYNTYNSFNIDFFGIILLFEIMLIYMTKEFYNSFILNKKYNLFRVKISQDIDLEDFKIYDKNKKYDYMGNNKK